MENIPDIESVLYPGATVKIEFVDQNHRKSVAGALVRDISRDELIMELPDAEAVLGQLPRKAAIPIIFKIDNEPRDLVFFTEYLKHIEDPPLLTVKRPSSYMLGRSFLRYNVNLPFSYFLDGVEYGKCKIENLSFGGMSGLIEPNDLLAIGMEIVCQISLPELSDSEFIVGRLVRMEEQPPGYRISVQFEDLTADIADKIAKYFFSIEKHMVKNGKSDPLEKGK